MKSHGDFVDISFDGGSCYRFHAEWLRDACRDENFVKNAAGERLLHQFQLVKGTPSDIKCASAEIDPDGVLHVTFDSEETCTFTAKCYKHMPVNVLSILVVLESSMLI